MNQATTKPEVETMPRKNGEGLREAKRLEWKKEQLKYLEICSVPH
jgi:hypothetical protein